MTAAAAAVAELGVGDTTLADVQDRAHVSRSQLFHYFPGGKDDLFHAVAAHETERVSGGLRARIPPLTDWAGWTRWRDQALGDRDLDGAACPALILANQLAPATDGARSVAAAIIAGWHGHVRSGIAHMRADGLIDVAVDPDEAASAVIAAVHGGVAMLAATGSRAHLAAAIDTAIEYLRAPAR